MKKVLVIIIVGLSGVIGYQMEQMTKLKQDNNELQLQIEDLALQLESYDGMILEEVGEDEVIW